METFKNFLGVLTGAAPMKLWALFLSGPVVTALAFMQTCIIAYASLTPAAADALRDAHLMTLFIILVIIVALASVSIKVKTARFEGEVDGDGAS